MRIRWHTWLIVFITLAAAGEGFGALLTAQGLPVAGELVRWAGRLLISGWIVFALIRFHEVPWVRRLTAIIAMTLAAALVTLFFRALGATNGVYAALGAYGMALTLYLGVLAIRTMLSPGWAVLGVARTLIDEAMRMKVPLVFIVAMLLLVPVLPLAMDPSEKLQYRLQSFLSWSLILVSLLLSLMTVFLSVMSVSNEIDRRRIYLTLTKPLSRGQYLLGKWLGVALLNLVLVAVAGGGIYGFTWLLAKQSATSKADRAAVDQQVLTARRTIQPIGIDPAKPNPPGYGQRIAAQLEKMRRQNPDRFGKPGSPRNATPPGAMQEVFQTVRDKWYTLDPRETTEYRFTGLGDVKGERVQLRLKPQSGETLDPGRLHLRITINGKLYRHPTKQMMAGERIKLIRGTAQVLDVPTERINAEGELVVTMTNPALNGRNQPSIFFNTTDGMQVLYQVGGFGGNLARGLAMTWVKLCFVGALGIAAGALLSFPVASVLCLLVFVTAMSSGFLVESINQYGQAGGATWAEPIAMLQILGANLLSGQVWAALKPIVSLVGSGFMLLVPAFDQYDPAPLISEGELVSFAKVGSALLWVGVIWSGVIGLGGFLLFRRRELAQVTV